MAYVATLLAFTGFGVVIRLLHLYVPYTLPASIKRHMDKIYKGGDLREN